MEQEEAAHEHDKGDGAEGDIQVSPAFVLGSRATGWTADVARFKTRVARVVREKPPGHSTWSVYWYLTRGR